MAGYDSIQGKKNQLIRKALNGSAFIAPYSAAAITSLTTGVGAGLAPLPTDYDDAGWMTSDGITLAQAISTSETTSWGSTEPTRSDITKETTTAKVVLQETKALTIGLYTGADLSSIEGDSVTSEVSIEVPLVPSSRYYRLLALAVDTTDAGEIYVARFLPRVKVTDKDDQKLSMADDGITWGVTLTGFQDSVLGYSQRFIFGGPGWAAMLADAGFTKASA
jgi:hypothetical protein